MAALETLFASPARSRRRPGSLHPLLMLAMAMLAPGTAGAHERWVPHKLRFPVDQAYFQSMTGEVLVYSIAATIAVFGLVVLWYLSAPGFLEALTPITPSAKAREAQRGFFSRSARSFLRIALDGDSDSPFIRTGLKVATFVFGRLPAFVLGLGAYEGWLVMPSFPLDGPVALPLRIASAVLAVWVLSGLFWRALGVVFLLVFVYLCFAYGIVAIDAIPVLASAFFYLFAPKDKALGVTSRQLMGVRVSLGLGFFLLGLINKIYIHDVFIGVADQHPAILAGPQELFPALTREAWSFTTALGEMVFGLMMLIGIFNRVTTLLLAFVFSNFMLVFGWAEIVHVYPIAGFMLLFFRGSAGTSLDGAVFRANVRFWRWMRHSSAHIVYGSAVTTIAASTASALMLAPLALAIEVVPEVTGDAVGRHYKRPPPLPRASKWPALDAPSPTPSAAPHADHRPHHDGVVTMSGDNHVEIRVRRDGMVHLFVTDAVRAPIPPSEVHGTLKLDHPGFSRTLALSPDASGALTVSGPTPLVATTYTYNLVIRGTAASMSLAVPPGGTDGIQK